LIDAAGVSRSLHWVNVLPQVAVPTARAGTHFSLVRWIFMNVCGRSIGAEAM
jgi:hypothetical protein